MALDRQCTAINYVAGRMIAIAEHYAGSKFGPNTLSTMFSHPAHGIDVWRRYIDHDDEYYLELQDIALPVTTANEVVKSQMWVGYYHQKAAYGDTTHGGLRPGSGRKPSGIETATVSFRLPLELCEKVKTLRASGIDITAEVAALITRL